MSQKIKITRLFYAMLADDVQTVKKIFQALNDPNICSNTGETLLSTGVSFNAPRAINFLLNNAKSDPYQANNDPLRETAIHVATKKGKKELFWLLRASIFDNEQFNTIQDANQETPNHRLSDRGKAFLTEMKELYQQFRKIEQSLANNRYDELERAQSYQQLGAIIDREIYQSINPKLSADYRYQAFYLDEILGYYQRAIASYHNVNWETLTSDAFSEGKAQCQALLERSEYLMVEHGKPDQYANYLGAIREIHKALKEAELYRAFENDSHTQPEGKHQEKQPLVQREEPNAVGWFASFFPLRQRVTHQKVADEKQIAQPGSKTSVSHFKLCDS